MKSGLLGVVVVALAWLVMPSSEAGMNFDEMFMRGDANADGAVNVSDPMYIGNFLHAGGPPPSCLDLADANGDGGVDISDQMFLFNYLFSAGPAPYGSVPCN